MKKIILSLALLIIGLLFFVSATNAATCEEKMMCIDDKHIGFQKSDCSIISVDQFFMEFSNNNDPTNHVCYIGCRDGECITDNTKPECNDSDGGDNYFVKGVVSLKQDGANQSGNDYCVDNKTLVERKCQKDSSNRYLISMINFVCPNGCVDGACVKVGGDTNVSTCLDSDGGKDIFKAGAITLNGKKINDTDDCKFNPQEIEELYCLPDGTYSSEIFKCPGLCQDTVGGDVCSQTCQDTRGFYCLESANSVVAMAYLTKDCKWEKHTPCQSNFCTNGSCASFDNKIDTDGDGLLDVNEEIFGTDPNNYDTDGDGYGDMAEINNGYDPLGPGKLTPNQLILIGQMTTTSVDLNITTSSEEVATSVGSTTTSSNIFSNPKQMAAGLLFLSIFAFLKLFLENQIIIGLILLLIIFFYIYSSLCLQLISKKLNIVDSWMAWIPIANIYLMVQCANKPVFWFWIIMFVPIINSILLIVVWVEICRRLGLSSWWIVLSFVPVINFIILGYLAFSKIGVSTSNFEA